MVRASRVANPMSRALGAGVVIGGMTAALFLMTEAGIEERGYSAAQSPIAAKVVPAS